MWPPQKPSAGDVARNIVLRSYLGTGALVRAAFPVPEFEQPNVVDDIDSALKGTEVGGARVEYHSSSPSARYAP